MKIKEGDFKKLTRQGERKIEGYWYSEHLEKYKGIKYPMPEPNVLTEDEAIDIHALIKAKEEFAHVQSYRGWSRSRITGENLGNKEYETEEWLWPGDFADHYVLKHRVKPTDDFLNYIGYKK
jgi:hypothetical protein